MTAIAIGYLAEDILHGALEKRDAWTFIANTFRSGDARCETCGYMKVSITRVPEGESTVPKIDSDCTLGWRDHHKPSMCPAWQAHLTALEEEAEDSEEPPIPCPECGGAGARDGIECTNCDGAGRLHPTTGEPIGGATQ